MQHASAHTHTHTQSVCDIHKNTMRYSEIHVKTQTHVVTKTNNRQVMLGFSYMADEML